jgi:excisionase family DNA binding protein
LSELSDLSEMTESERPAEALASQSAWLTMGAASRMLGVSTATLRRWADEGRIAAYPTPGGHRRFARSAVEGLMPRQAPAASQFSGVASPDSIHRAYRRTLGEGNPEHSFLDAVPSGAREGLREYGRVVTGSILAYLQATAPVARDTALAEGLIAAAAYGRIAGTLGATMRETVATFLRFRTPFVKEMAEAARRQGLDAAGTAELLEAMTVAIDRLLDATLEGYEHAGTHLRSTAPPRGRGRG